MQSWWLRTTHTNTAVLDSEDTYVYVQAAYVSHQIRGKLLIKCKQALINCHAMLPDDISNIILPLHVITASDHTSGFYSHGEKPLLQKLIKYPEARELLRVDESLGLKDEVKADMKVFILSKVHGEDITLTCGQARASKWQKLKRRVQSASHLMKTHWTTTAHEQTTSLIASSISVWWNIWPQLAMAGKSSMANGNQCDTRYHHCPTRSWLMSICSIAVMRAGMMMTVGQESQQIQMSNMHNLKFKDQNYA